MVQVLAALNIDVPVTDMAWTGLQSIAGDFGISVSELLERLGNRQLILIDPKVLETSLDLRHAPTLADAEAIEEEYIAWEHIEELGTL